MTREILQKLKLFLLILSPQNRLVSESKIKAKNDKTIFEFFGTLKKLKVPKNNQKMKDRRVDQKVMTKIFLSENKTTLTHHIFDRCSLNSNKPPRKIVWLCVILFSMRI